MVTIDLAKVGTIVSGLHIAFGFALFVCTCYVSKKSLIEPEYDGDLAIFFEVGYGYGFLGVTTSLLTMMYGAYYIYYFTLNKATEPQRLLQRFHGWGGALWLMLLQLAFLFGALLWVQSTLDHTDQDITQHCPKNTFTCDLLPLMDDPKPKCGETNENGTWSKECFLSCKIAEKGGTLGPTSPSYYDTSDEKHKPCKDAYITPNIGQNDYTPNRDQLLLFPNVRVLTGGGNPNNSIGKTDDLAKSFSAIVAFAVLCFLAQSALLSLVSRYPEQFGGGGEISAGDSTTSINVSLATLILMGFELAFGFALFVVTCYLAERSLTEPEYEGSLSELFKVNYGVGFVGITCAFNVIAYGLTHLWFFKMGKTNNAQRMVNRMQGWGGATILMCLQIAILYGYIIYQVQTIDDFGKENNPSQLIENCGDKFACGTTNDKDCDKDCVRICNAGNDKTTGSGPCSLLGSSGDYYPDFRVYSGLTDSNEESDKNALHHGLQAAVAFSVLLLLNHIPWEFFLSKYPGQFEPSGSYAPQTNTYDDVSAPQSGNYGGTSDGGGYQSL